jgi:hypothetical protein
MSSDPRTNEELVALAKTGISCWLTSDSQLASAGEALTELARRLEAADRRLEAADRRARAALEGTVDE